jgi:hypothetical protein
MERPWHWQPPQLDVEPLVSDEPVEPNEIPPVYAVAATEVPDILLLHVVL